MMENCALILAAGNGTRMKSNYPKALCEVLFKPMINWVIGWCQKAGIERICVVLGDGAEYVERILPAGCITVRQAERKGTGHAVMMAEQFLRENLGRDIVVLNSDAPFINNEIIEASGQKHRACGAAVTVITAETEEPKGYGRIIRDGENPDTVVAIVEQKDATADQQKIKEINSGAYWFQTDFLLEALGKLDCNNKQKEYYLTDTVKIAAMQGKKVAAYKSDSESLILGANDRAGLLKLNAIANKLVIDRLLDNGVNFYCTDGVVISPDAVIGRDTTIAPGTLIKGKVTIGEECEIGPNTVIEDSTIGNGCRIHSSLIEQSQVGREVRIGPNSHLRPHSVLADGVKVGNFVEIKNSAVGENTSVAHLTYIGDTDMGSNVNVGCGVVTVNYNGYQKFRTTVEDHAFIGCNTNLVAPVTIKEGAYTAAGSTITEDVEQEALGIGRARQENKPGWAGRYRVRCSNQERCRHQECCQEEKKKN